MGYVYHTGISFDDIWVACRFLAAKVLFGAYSTQIWRKTLFVAKPAVRVFKSGNPKGVTEQSKVAPEMEFSDKSADRIFVFRLLFFVIFIIVKALKVRFLLGDIIIVFAGIHGFVGQALEGVDVLAVSQ